MSYFYRIIIKKYGLINISGALLLLFFACPPIPKQPIDEEKTDKKPEGKILQPISRCPLLSIVTEKIRPLSVEASTVIASIHEQASALPITDAQKIAQHALKLAKKFPPERGVKINDIEMYLSRSICFTNTERIFAILYTNYEGQWYARALYRSFSGGIWRSSAGTLGKTYDKGIHYTQDNRLHQALSEILNAHDNKDCLSSSEDIIITYFNLGVIGLGEGYRISHKSLDIENELLASYESGRGFNECTEEARTKFLSGMTEARLKDFYPNFSCLNRSYQQSHALLSPESSYKNHTLVNNIQVDVFLASINHRVVEWHFAYVKGTKEPWITRIRFADEKISSYGGDEGVILSGAITLKPIEYAKYTTCLKENRDFRYLPSSPVYVDIRPFLQTFPPIIDYKKYKNQSKTW